MDLLDVTASDGVSPEEKAWMGRESVRGVMASVEHSSFHFNVHSAVCFHY